VKHYFIQTVPVTETFSAGDYELQAISLIEKLFSEGHETLVMAGGSMLYVDAICKGLDDLPDGNQQLRDELWQQLKEEGVRRTKYDT
jgi:tRNA dimethylallyltransferase